MGLALVIDVLLAAYNGEKYLPEQLASLQAQTAADFRVLMQDDGSADATPELLTSVCRSDPRFALGQAQGQHLGAVGNFLSLLRQSDADYTALCDQDDVWSPDRLDACRRALQEAEARLGRETPLLVHSDARLIDAEGRELAPSFFGRQGWDGTAVTLPRLLVQNNVTGCTLMMNAALRDLVATHGDANAMFMHDWFIALTAAAFGQIIFLDHPLVNYRQHGSNVMGASAQGQLGRAARAAAMYKRSRARIALTYTHTRAFRDTYGALLPAAAQETIDRYLATEALSKVRRVAAVRRAGYTMQSRMTRLGQIIFG